MIDQLQILKLSTVSGVLNSFDVDVTNVSGSALTTHSSNNNFAGRLVVDISHCEARLAEEY